MPGKVYMARITEEKFRLPYPTPKGKLTFDHRFLVFVQVSSLQLCSLEWWEKTDRPYRDDMPRNEWIDMYELQPDSPVFAEWEAERTTPGLVGDSIRLVDIPGLMLGEGGKRTLNFEIRVKERNPVGVENRQHVIRARQYLDCDRLDECDFEVIAEHVEIADDDGVAPSW